MMESKMIDSQEQHILDAVNSKYNLVDISKDVCSVIRPNQILFVKKNSLNSLNLPEINISEHKKIKDILSVTLVPTLDCNLSCIYCYSKGGDSNKKMSPNMAAKFIEVLYKNGNYRSIHIRFAGGGEPFLNFECMKVAVNKARELTNNVSLHCITNGTFNEEQLKWIIKNRAQVRISFDGFFQGKQRPDRNGQDSFANIEKNIKKLIKENIDVITQTTITSLNVSSMSEIASQIASFGVKTIKMEPVYITDNSRGNPNLNVKPKEFTDNFIKMIEELRKQNYKVKIDTSFFSRPTIGHYCSLAEGNLILTPEGFISGCVEITNSCDLFSDFVFYGKFDENTGKILINKERLKEFKKFHFINDDSCSLCNLKMLCRGGCPMRSLWKQKKQLCTISKILTPEILKLFYKDKNYITMFKNET